MTFTKFVNGTSADADEVNATLDFARFLNQKQVLSNATTDDFTADNSQTSTNLVYNTTLDEYSSIALVSSTILELAENNLNTDNATTVPSMQVLNQGIVRFQYELFMVYDECNDSSLDTTLWTCTTAGVGAEGKTENTQLLTNKRTHAGVGALSAETSTHASNGDFYGDKHIMLIFNNYSSYQFTGNKSASVNIFDGSTSVAISTSTGSAVRRYDFFFDTSNTQVRVWSNGSEMGASPFDLSGLSGVWRIRLRADAQETTGGTVSANNLIYCCREYKQTGDYSTVVTEAISTDSGGNYTSAVKGFINTIGNAEIEDFTAKLTCTLAADEGIVLKGNMVSAWNAGYHWGNS